MAKKIAAKLPDFTIENNQLNPVNSNEKGFIYQTDSIIFTFDPEGKTETEKRYYNRYGRKFFKHRSFKRPFSCCDAKYLEQVRHF